MTLREFVTDEGWIKIKQHPLKETLRNCNLLSMTLEEIMNLSIIFNKASSKITEEMYNVIYTEKIEERLNK